MKRERIHHKPTYRMVGSSDVERVHQRHEALREFHEEFLKTKLAYSGIAIARPLTPILALTIYKEVRIMGSWEPISKYREMLSTLIREHYQFR